MIKKGDILEEIPVLDFAAGSKCVAKVEGQVIFIEQTAPGDVVDIRITKKKKTFLEAKPIYFHEFSSKRQTPFCGHYGICGGCKWQHILYESQLEFKQQQVVDQMQRIGRLNEINMEPILGASKYMAYRNKLEFTFTDQRWLTQEEIQSGETFERNGLGFHKPGQFDKVLDIETCYLQPNLSNKIRMAVKKIALQERIPFYNLRTHEGFLRNLIIRNSNNREWMVILQVKEEKRSWIEKILNGISEKCPEVSSLFYIINAKRNESYSDLEAIHYAGEKFITETMKGLEFRIGPKSFFQTNSHQAYELYKKICEYGEFNQDDTVFDLYTGTGTIAIFIARKVKKVIGLEYVAEAVQDARINSEINQITNVTFFEGDISKIFDEVFIGEHGHPDVIITDPPRAGMHRDVIDVLLEAGPRRIIYVSCNPATQARDIDMLKKEFRLVKSQPVDMFPHTHHIENIAVLDKI